MKRYNGKIDYWQIWNEPNGGFWKGTPEQYALLLAAAGKAIHEANPEAKVLGLNMAFCDVLWAETILKAVPYDCFDIACFHPYRPPSAPEEHFDWWELDQYVKSWHKHDLTAEYPLVRMSFPEQTEELVKVMAQFGKPKPLWITEICWNTHIHPYGTSELRQADLLVRFHVLAIASGQVEKVFWWTLKDGGDRQFDQADMVGLVRADLTPKYAYYAFAWMTRMLEGKKLLRSDCFGPDTYAVVFGEDGSDEDMIVAWSTKPYAYIRVNNPKGLTFYDIFGTRRFVPYDPVRTKNLRVPLGESPIYIVGPKGLKAELRKDPVGDAMKRREFLAATMKTAAGLALTQIPAVGASRPQRPNILFIMTDQQHAGMMSCTGNRWLKTPALDRLAASGIRFERAYACQPRLRAEPVQPANGPDAQRHRHGPE